MSFFSGAPATQSGSQKRVSFHDSPAGQTAPKDPLWRRVFQYVSAEERAPYVAALTKVGLFVAGIVIVRKYGKDLFVLPAWDEGLPKGPIGEGAIDGSLPAQL